MHPRLTLERVGEAATGHGQAAPLVQCHRRGPLDPIQGERHLLRGVLRGGSEDVEATRVVLRHHIHVARGRHETFGEGSVDHRRQAMKALVHLLGRSSHLGIGRCDQYPLAGWLAGILFVEVVVEVLDTPSATDDGLPHLGLHLSRCGASPVSPRLGEDVRRLDEHPHWLRTVGQFTGVAGGPVDVPHLARRPRVRDRVVVERGDVTRTGERPQVVQRVRRPVAGQCHRLGVLVEHRAGGVAPGQFVAHGVHRTGEGVASHHTRTQFGQPRRQTVVADIDAIGFIGEVAGCKHRTRIGRGPRRTADHIHTGVANGIEHGGGDPVVQAHEGVDAEVFVLLDPRQFRQRLVPHPDGEERRIGGKTVRPSAEIVGTPVDGDQGDPSRQGRCLDDRGTWQRIGDDGTERGHSGKAAGDDAMSSPPTWGRGMRSTRRRRREQGHGSSKVSAPPSVVFARMIRSERPERTPALRPLSGHPPRFQA